MSENRRFGVKTVIAVWDVIRIEGQHPSQKDKRAKATIPLLP